MAEDPARFPAEYAYGKSTYQSDHVDDVVKAQNLAGLADKFNDIKEDKYASHVREPLGRGYSRQYDWPAHANAGNMKFGVPSTGLESAKDMIYPMGGAMQNDDKTI